MRTRRATTPEGAILRACLDLLAWHRIPAWRSNTGVALLPGRGGVPRPVRFGVNGCSDILAVWPDNGRLMAIECKTPRGVVTDAQRAFLTSVRDAHGVAIVARDVAFVDRAIQILRDFPEFTFPLEWEAD